MDESEINPAEGSEPPPEEGASRRVRLNAGGGIHFEEAGFRIVGARGLKRSPLESYSTLTHVYAGERMLLVGTRTGIHQIPRRDFKDPKSGPESARALLLERVGGEPDGAAQLSAMEAVDRLGDRDGPAWVVWLVASVCLLATGLQLANPMIEQIGAFLRELFYRGEFWRAMTLHLVHDLTVLPAILRQWLPFDVAPIHLALNMAGLLVLGHLVERPLGAWRMATVFAFSGAGTVVGILVAGHVQVIGASGLVSGLAGAILALELHYPDALPAYWRLPRRLLIGALVLQFGVVDQIFAGYLAGGAHLGGFAGGYLAVYLTERPSVEALDHAGSQRFAGLCAAVSLGVAIGAALPLARHDMAALERHADRLLNTPSAIYLFRHENAAAWLIATEGGASMHGLDVAVALADRAVQSTGRLHPGLLDTLAEALFQRGDRLGALLTIEEAIRLQPWEPYFFEQRRRFLGERAPDDRPPPPGSVPPSEIPFDEEFEPIPIGGDESSVTI